MNTYELYQMAKDEMFSYYMLKTYSRYLSGIRSANFKARRNRTAYTDSQRSKVYTAESRWENSLYDTHGTLTFRSMDDAEKFMKRIIKGQLLHKEYRKNNLKMSFPKEKTAKTPQEWLKLYEKAATARGDIV